MEKQYWIQREGKISGPFSGQQLEQMFTSGMIAESDLISTDQVNWTVRDGFSELSEQGDPPPREHGATSVAQAASVEAPESDSTVDDKEQMVSDPAKLAPKTISQSPIQRPECSLHEAAREGNIEQVKLHLTWGADINLKDYYGNTPLHDAVSCASFCETTDIDTMAMLEFLLANKADINAPGQSGTTPIHIAARGSNAKLVEFLITMGANVEAQTVNGNTPLHDVSYDRPEIVSAILASGPPIFLLMQETNKRGENPLHCFASAGNFKAIRSVFKGLQAIALRRIQDKTDFGAIEPMDMANDALLDSLMEDPAYREYYKRHTSLFINMWDNYGRTPLERSMVGLIDRIQQTTSQAEAASKREVARILRAHGAKRSPLCGRGFLTPKIAFWVLMWTLGCYLYAWQRYFNDAAYWLVAIPAIIIFFPLASTRN
jgi:hypothetical protein